MRARPSPRATRPRYCSRAFSLELGAELHKLTNGTFFALAIYSSAETGAAPVAAFLSWLDAVPADAALMRNLSTLLKGTPVTPGWDLIEVLRARMERIHPRSGRNGMHSPLRSARPRLATSSSQLSTRLANSNVVVLSAATCSASWRAGAFASYGFPTDVVQFVTETAGEKAAKQRASDAGDEPQERSFGRGYPSRSREVGIFEYAPGRAIVVDGVVRCLQGSR